MLCWHRWSKWVTIEKARKGVFVHTDPLLMKEIKSHRQYEDQRRACEKCGKSQLRRVIL